MLGDDDFLKENLDFERRNMPERACGATKQVPLLLRTGPAAQKKHVRVQKSQFWSKNTRRAEGAAEKKSGF